MDWFLWEELPRWRLGGLAERLCVSRWGVLCELLSGSVLSLLDLMDQGAASATSRPLLLADKSMSDREDWPPGKSSINTWALRLFSD